MPSYSEKTPHRSSCMDCNRVVYLPTPPEPRQPVQCESCWYHEREERARAGAYAYASDAP